MAKAVIGPRIAFTGFSGPRHGQLWIGSEKPRRRAIWRGESLTTWDLQRVNIDRKENRATKKYVGHSSFRSYRTFISYIVSHYTSINKPGISVLDYVNQIM